MSCSCDRSQKAEPCVARHRAQTPGDSSVHGALRQRLEAREGRSVLNPEQVCAGQVRCGARATATVWASEARNPAGRVQVGTARRRSSN